MTPLPSESPVQPSPWRWWVCVMLLLASTLNYMDRMALSQTAVRIKLEFGLNNTWFGVLESVFTIGFAIGGLTFGWLVDRVKMRWIYPVAVIGWSMAGFMTGFAQGYWFLLMCRIGLGVFEAGNWPCGIRTSRMVMPVYQRSLGNAFFQNGTAIGAVITPFIVLACIAWADPSDSERAAAQAVGGGAVVGIVGLPPAGVWQVPFRVIGAIGLVWVALWLLTVPSSILRPISTPGGSNEPETPTPFSAVLTDRRFWLLVALVLAVNTSWHTVRFCLPFFLQQQHGYSEREMNYLSVGYYFVADLGAWAVGLGSLVLARFGFSIFRSQTVSFGVCALIVCSSLLIPFIPRGPVLIALLFVYGFGSFGLFPTYFALTQSLAAAHQGKVTGTLGCINALYLTGMYTVEGAINDAVGRYDYVMAVAGLPAVAALILVVLFWRDPMGAEPRPRP